MELLTVQIQRLRPADDLSLPRYMSSHAAGMDLTADIHEPVLLQPGARVLIPTGIALAIPEGYEAQTRPRSGLALRHGISLVNSPGTIDADYRGEIRVIVINHGDTPVAIKRGERIAQLVFSRVARVQFKEVEELDVTERGSGGFGHTGV